MQPRKYVWSKQLTKYTLYPFITLQLSKDLCNSVRWHLKASTSKKHSSQREHLVLWQKLRKSTRIVRYTFYVWPSHSLLNLKEHSAYSRVDIIDSIDGIDRIDSMVSGHIASSQIASMEAMCLEAIWQCTHTCRLPPLNKIYIVILIIGDHFLFIDSLKYLFILFILY